MQFHSELVANHAAIRRNTSADVGAGERLRRMTFDLVAEARKLATDAHADQLDKAGKPYIDHPRRVAERAASFGPEFAAVAWLHDVIEDTRDLEPPKRITAEDLRAADFPEAVVEGVVAMTKELGEEHPAAVARACHNDLARVVKAADVADNADPARLALIKDAAKRTKLTDRYALAREVLDQYDAPKF